MKQPFQYSDPDAAIAALAERLSVVGETEPVAEPVGRIIAESIVADRDSPAADVSAMDGYAIRMSDLQSDSVVPVSGISQAGAAPPAMVEGQVVRIFTGAIIPDGCQAVVKREDTEELDASIRFLPAAIESTVSGSHIRRRGENAPAGSNVLDIGTEVTPAVVAALANFGCTTPVCYRRVKVAVLTTGDEVVDPATPALEPWQLRNSNRAAVEAMLGQYPSAILEIVEHVKDDRDSLRQSLDAAIAACDVVVLTGGVSMGDYDYVPDTIEHLGAEIVFHGLPIRPGKPILGAATKDGKLVLGLPGNPVSATINCHRFLMPLLRRIAGKPSWPDKPSMVTLVQPPKKAIPLHTMLLVRMTDTGAAELVSAKGSGDLVALGRSDGYVAVPPMTTTTGPWPMFRW
ncbi:molybdopterin molybdotransferase MoeA [Stieleria sp. ICT_E10.1]|uniref:molybdopterin molybdotransferase MoeA n=1 Tax=Stieleria sedimenti TaxID=2976331 RepID=UPI00217FE850|nr:molybdopterin molybdotransferase MoeA [Stieleria sedimenti]MCS7465572.1 molybdopterin molybdotransferase MoeA [Stieleria sedimenti]